ncbi:MAG: serine/threonine-protein kinase [Myxococcota bacterium]
MDNGEKGDPLAGTKYRRLHLLGAGAFGAVWAAEHRTLGHTAAVKVLKRVDNPNALKRFEMEAQALARIRHPNVCDVHDSGTTARGRPYVVMTHLEGRDLEAEIRIRDELEPATAVAWMVQILAGLEEIHRAGIVHRDLKPTNVFVEKSEKGVRMKLLDLGLLAVTGPEAVVAPPTTPLTEVGKMVGTPRYASPEQATGKKVDSRSDIYAAGLILYKMLCGRGPFDHERSIEMLMVAHAAYAPTPPSRWSTQAIPEWLDAMVLRALEKAPADRFDSAAAFAAALRQAMAAPSSAPRPRRAAGGTHVIAGPWPQTELGTRLPARGTELLLDPAATEASSAPRSREEFDDTVVNPTDAADTMVAPGQNQRLPDGDDLPTMVSAQQAGPIKIGPVFVTMVVVAAYVVFLIGRMW